MSKGLRNEQKVLQALSDGHKSNIELRRVLGWSPISGQHRALESLLQRMRVAGMIEPKDRKKGIWGLAEGVTVCDCCQGRGITLPGLPSQNAE